MSWDYQKTLSEITQSVGDIFRLKYGLKAAKQTQPLIIETYQKTIIPTLIIVGFVILLIVQRKKVR